MASSRRSKELPGDNETLKACGLTGNFHEGDATKGEISYLKAAGSVLLALYGFSCARSVEQGPLLDNVDLIAHEAGHLFFGFFGEFLGIAGGTLGQLLVPAGFDAYFAARRERFSSCVALFWVGQNLLNISVYLQDAAAMGLPLVSMGGGDSIHDWNWLLSKFNLLAYDRSIGSLVFRRRRPRDAGIGAA